MHIEVQSSLSEVQSTLYVGKKILTFENFEEEPKVIQKGEHSQYMYRLQ